MIAAGPHAEAQRSQRAAARPEISAWVSASAGSGKTKVLSDRVLNLLLSGTPAHRILCLTFTKAAAAEMANRIARRLARWATLPDPELTADLAELSGRPPEAEVAVRARRLFAGVLDTPDGMKILTIHAFCQSLLRRFPLEAGLAPHFMVMDDRHAAELQGAAREEVLAAARDGADGTLAEALAEVTSHVGEATFPDLMEDLARDRGRLRRMIDRHGGLDGVAAALVRRLGLKRGDTPEAVLAAACADTAVDAAGCRRALAALRRGAKGDVERSGIMAAWLADPDGRAATFEAWSGVFLTKGGEVRARLISKAAHESDDGALAILETEAERLLRVADRRRAAATARATLALLRLADALLAAYQRHKGGRALLDYDDLVLAAVRLLNGQGMAAWVLYKLDGGIDHLLIDEAQDTNPDQWAVVRALTDEFFAGDGARAPTRTVFAVGDPKQSIYSFQRADPRGFEAMRQRYRQAVPEAGKRFEEYSLYVSFRSTRAVLDAVDAVCNSALGGDGVVPDGEEIRHVPARQRQGGAVELWPPLSPRPIDDPEAWKPPVERVRGDSPRARLARLVARRIHAMVAGGEMLASKGRTIRAGDVLVLVRRRNAFVEDLVRELKALAVPVAGSDRMVLAQQLAVMDLMALGQFLLLPDDDLTLATVLKSPLVGLDEDQLFDLAWNRGGRSLWAEVKRRAERFPQAHALLAGLLAMADGVRPHELFARVLGPLDGRRRLLERLGWEAEDAIDEFMTLTIAYEHAHAPSLQGFLHWLDSGAVEIKRDLEQGGHDAVRIMTVHGAKGLQAPVVFLPDTMQIPSQSPRLLWDGAEAAELMLWPPRAELADPVCRAAREAAQLARDREYRRLLYVAMTRAEDRLIVCGWETRRAAPVQCWYHLVGEALARTADTVTDPFLASQPDAGGTEVLRLTCAQTAPPEAERLAAATAAAAGPPPAWVDAAPANEPSPPRPLMPSRPDDEQPSVRSPLGTDDGLRFRRGRLIHRLLQTLPEVPIGQRAAIATRFLTRPDWRLTAAQQAEIAMETQRLLDDSDFAAIFGPGSRAEVPVVGRIGERIVSGQVDRLLVTASEVLVVDFKTNRPPPRDPADVAPAYLRQMAAYRAALACIYPGRTIRCALLWTDGPRLMTLDSRRLDDALAGLGDPT